MVQTSASAIATHWFQIAYRLRWLQLISPLTSQLFSPASSVSLQKIYSRGITTPRSLPRLVTLRLRTRQNEIAGRINATTDTSSLRSRIWITRQMYNVTHKLICSRSFCVAQFAWLRRVRVHSADKRSIAFSRVLDTQQFNNLSLAAASVSTKGETFPICYSKFRLICSLGGKINIVPLPLAVILAPWMCYDYSHPSVWLRTDRLFIGLPEVATNVD